MTDLEKKIEEAFIRAAKEIRDVDLSDDFFGDETDISKLIKSCWSEQVAFVRAGYLAAMEEKKVRCTCKPMPDVEECPGCLYREIERLEDKIALKDKHERD